MSHFLRGVLCALVVAGATAAHAQVSWTFDCTVENWITTPFHEMSWSGAGGQGVVVLTYTDEGEGAYDPVFQSPSGNAIDLTETPFVIIEFEAINVPTGDDAALFLFGGGGIWRVGFAENGLAWGPGQNRVVIDMGNVTVLKIAGDEGVEFDNTPIEIVRYDIPDNAPFAGYENAQLRVDFVAVAATPGFVPAQDITPCPGAAYPSSPPGTPGPGGALLMVLAAAGLALGVQRLRR